MQSILIGRCYFSCLKNKRPLYTAQWNHVHLCARTQQYSTAYLPAHSLDCPVILKFQSIVQGMKEWLQPRASWSPYLFTIWAWYIVVLRKKKNHHLFFFLNTCLFVLWIFVVVVLVPKTLGTSSSAMDFNEASIHKSVDLRNASACASYTY